MPVRTLGERDTRPKESTIVKKFITLAVLAAVLAAPVVALADDITSNVAMSASGTLVVVDQSGNVLGQLVPVASSTNAIRESAERARALPKSAIASTPDTRWHARQPESKEFWDQFNQGFASVY